MANFMAQAAERLAGIFNSSKQDSSREHVYGTVTSISDASLEVKVDSPGRPVVKVIRMCNPVIGSRVLIRKFNTQWLALSVVGGDAGGSGALESAYPVGSIYMNANVSTNPATLFGFGTWEAFGAGRVPVGMGSNGTTNYSSVRATGGAESVKLTEAQMPKHRHAVYLTGSGQGTSLEAFKIESYVYNDPAPQRNAGYALTMYNGSDANHENRMPYITVYMWRRTA